MSLNAISLDSLRTIPTVQKVALLGLVVAAILVGFYYYIVDPKNIELEAVQGQVAQLDTEIQNLTIKVKHLDELIAASKQLEIDLAKKKERLPAGSRGGHVAEAGIGLGHPPGARHAVVEAGAPSRGSLEVVRSNAGKRRGGGWVPHRRDLL